MNIYVGNLSYKTSEDELRAAFAAFGGVSRAHIVTDRYSGQSKGFGFVEMPILAEAHAAIDALNGGELDGRALRVSEARPRAGRGDA